MMLEIYQYGPISVGILIEHGFISYKSGIWTGCLLNSSTQHQLTLSGCSVPATGSVNYYEPTSHAVTIVGWGTHEVGQA